MKNNDWHEAYFDLVNKVECECVQQGDLVPIWDQFKAMSAELAKFKTLAETLAGALGDIFERFDAKTPNHRGNAPGHGHETPGIWDADNGEKAGQPCVWCKDWNSAREALRQYKEARDAS